MLCYLTTISNFRAGLTDTLAKTKRLALMQAFEANSVRSHPQLLYKVYYQSIIRQRTSVRESLHDSSATITNLRRVFSCDFLRFHESLPVSCSFSTKIKLLFQRVSSGYRRGGTRNFYCVYTSNFQQQHIGYPALVSGNEEHHSFRHRGRIDTHHRTAAFNERQNQSSSTLGPNAMMCKLAKEQECNFNPFCDLSQLYRSRELLSANDCMKPEIMFIIRFVT